MSKDPLVIWVNPEEFELCQTKPIYMDEHNELLNGMPRQIAALAARTDHCCLALMPATPPAAQVQGELPEVVAYRRFEAQDNEYADWELYLREVESSEPLMTVAQHERIVAARSCPCQTDTARETRRKDAAEAVELQRILFEQHQGCRPLDAGLMGWAAAALSAPPAAEETAHQIRLLATALGECIEAAGITTPGAAMSGPQLLMFADDLKQMLAAPPAAGVPEGNGRVLALFRKLGTAGIEALPGYEWFYPSQYNDLEEMIENGSLLEHFDAYIGYTAPTPPASEQQQAVVMSEGDEHEDHSASTAAIQFALELEDLEDIPAFLSMWNEGEFETIRLAWPDCPDEVFIGADPLFKPAAPSQGE